LPAREAAAVKQLLFVCLLTLIGTVGPFVNDPFCGVAVYYIFAVLRPQFLWQWSLPPDVQWSRFVALATIAGAVAGQLGLLPSRGGSAHRRKNPSPTNALMFFFFVWITLSYFMARNQDVAYPYYFEYLKIFAMFTASCLILGTVRQLWILFILAALSLGYISYEVNALYLFQGYLGIQRNGYGGLDNNGAGLMLAMGVPLCFFIWDGMRGWRRWLFIALIPVIIHAVLMTYSRGAMVSLIAVCPLLIFRSRHPAQLLPFGLLLAAAIPVLAGKEIRERFFTISEHEVDESANSRRASWAAAWAMAKETPIFGVGVRNANLFSHQYGADMEGRTIHSQYLQIAADNGFVGLGLYLAVIGSVWLDTHRARRAVAGCDDPEAGQVRAIASGVEGSLAVFYVGAVFLSLENFELPFMLMLLGTQLAAIGTTAQGGRQGAGSYAPFALYHIP
jgi:probable O-glycosylation ligase (exosortase A-associated)